MNMETDIGAQGASQRLVLVTGPSGAGRSTAIGAFEDLGFEVIDNLPLSLLPRLLEGPALARPIALGLDIRNRDFGVAALMDTMDGLARQPSLEVQFLYLDCSEEVLVRRYSETRRRHPLDPGAPPAVGVERERNLLAPLRARADMLIDTSALSPHDLRAEIGRWFATGQSAGFAVALQSFGYKRGIPHGLDLVMDCRFLRNPHWVSELRGLDGTDPAVDAYIACDPRFAGFFGRLSELVAFLLPAYREEGKPHLSIGFGCTGGQHRSVAVTERLAKALAEAGWQVSKRHRELERRAGIAQPAPQTGTPDP